METLLKTIPADQEFKKLGAENCIQIDNIQSLTETKIALYAVKNNACFEKDNKMHYVLLFTVSGGKKQIALIKSGIKKVLYSIKHPNQRQRQPSWKKYVNVHQKYLHRMTIQIQNSHEKEIMIPLTEKEFEDYLEQFKNVLESPDSSNLQPLILKIDSYPDDEFIVSKFDIMGNNLMVKLILGTVCIIKTKQHNYVPCPICGDTGLDNGKICTCQIT